MSSAHSNELFGWSAIGCGFVSGMLLGLRFHREDWLGGYASLRRRMIRLGHIALVALGVINILYAGTQARMAGPPLRFALAQWGFIVGAATMPLACFLTAWRPPLRALFVVPVAALLTACLMTIFGLVQS